MMNSPLMRAIVVDPRHPEVFVFKELLKPAPLPSEALVRVAALALNRGEIRRAMNQSVDGYRPGWEVAGVVEEAARDGSGPTRGDRVVCLGSGSYWAEYITCPIPALAVVPNRVSLEQASTLPVAGLTARRALQMRGLLDGKKVLVGAASGGVGTFALQLARNAGARVVAHIRSDLSERLVRQLGASDVLIGPQIDVAQSLAPYDLILESVGSSSLGASLTLLAHGGVCVQLGASEHAETTFDTSKFRIGGTSLYGLVMGYEFQHEPPCVGLAELLRTIEEGLLAPTIEVSSNWSNIASVAQGLMERRFFGKAVLLVE